MRILPLTATGVCLILAGVAVWQVIQSPDSIDEVPAYQAPQPPDESTVAVSVLAGQSPEDIGKEFEAAGAIESAEQFEILVSLLGYQGSLQAGEYEFAASTPEIDAAYRVRGGVLSARSVTVLEGWRLEEVADAFATQGIPRDEFISQARARNFDFSFLNDLRGNDTLEGYLYPARYPVRKGDTATDVITALLLGFESNVPASVAAEAEASGLTLHEAVTLASIIEREAVVPEERPIMAQVFLRRLREGIPLGADPTIQYAVAEDPDSVEQFGYWKTELTRADLEIDSPYNTYQEQGLPPGPISNPRLDSILAVVNPADTTYLYFVAKPDGSHAFASSLEEHQANIEQYLR
jgi:UPF0755 protein